MNTFPEPRISVLSVRTFIHGRTLTDEQIAACQMEMLDQANVALADYQESNVWLLALVFPRELPKPEVILKRIREVSRIPQRWGIPQPTLGSRVKLLEDIKFRMLDGYFISEGEKVYAFAHQTGEVISLKRDRMGAVVGIKFDTSWPNDYRLIHEDYLEVIV